MRRLLSTLLVIGLTAPAFAAPNVTNATQKGSLIIFPDIRIDDDWNTLVRLQNDGGSDVDVKCYWMDGNKNRVDFVLPMTRNQPVWFDARTGAGTWQINPFPKTPANGFDNPFLVGPQKPVQVSVGPFQVPGINGSVAAVAAGPGSFPVSPTGAVSVVQTATVTYAPAGGVDDFLFTTVTRAVTIEGVTLNIEQGVLVLLDGAGGFALIGLDPSDEAEFVLPDGRRILFQFESAFAFPAAGVSDLGLPARLRIVDAERDDTANPMGKGLLACWAVDPGGQQQVKWNHLSGTATLYKPNRGAYEYTAYAFFAPTGIDLEPVGTAGTLNLNGVEYDSCPLYQIGQFSPRDRFLLDVNLNIRENRLALAGCTLDLRQDWTPVWTKLQFDVWDENEVKFTGAFDCADSWHDTLFGDDLDAAAQNFDPEVLVSFAARYRVQPIKSTQCEDPRVPRVTQAVGVLGVQSTLLGECDEGCRDKTSIGTTLAAAGKFSGKILWDPAGTVPEGGIR